MALIAITVKDTEDGSLDIQALAEPYIPGPQELEEGAELTPAQLAAQVMVGALASMLAAAEVEAEDSTEDDSDLTEPMQ